MLYVYMMEFYSPIRKNENVKFGGKWMELEDFMCSIAFISGDQEFK